MTLEGKYFKNSLIHLSFIGLFMSIPLIVGLNTNRLDMVYKDLIFNIIVLGYFYLNYYYLVEKFLLTRNYIPFIVISLASMVLIYLLSELLFQFTLQLTDIKPSTRRLQPPHFDHPPHFSRNHTEKPSKFGYDIILLSHRFFIFIALLSTSIVIKSRQRMNQVEKEKRIAEIAQLKAQINPHFLFNTLNSIYALALEKSDLTPKAITQLSEMMRYVLEKSKDDFVIVQSEIDHLKSYIDLQKMRFGDEIEVETTFIGQFDQSFIAPLLLIPFVENAFKHGVNAEHKSKIEIEIRLEKQDFKMRVFNLKVPISSDFNTKSGYGIDITRSRLEHLYSHKYQLLVENHDDYFLVELKINLL